MKIETLISFLPIRYLLAAVAGLLMAFAFPKPGIAGFAWIAPGLILAVALGTRGAESFRIGYLAGLAHYLTSLHWILHIPVKGFPVLGWAALSSFLALFPATWAWFCIEALAGREHKRDAHDSSPSWRAAFEGLATRSWSRRVFWSLLCGAAWVGLEMLLTRIFGGFPWDLLGVSQFQIIPLIQLASVTGVYGLSFLLVWTSVSLLNAVGAILQRPTLRYVWMSEILLPCVAISGILAFGFHQLRNAPDPSRSVKITLIQPSIPQTLIWDPEGDTERFQELIRLSKQALTNETDVLIWPEAAVPKLLRYDEGTHNAIVDLAVQHSVWMIVGADDAAPRLNTPDPEDADFYNSSFLISPDGRLVADYKKRSLVIFGEYIPFERWLPFFKWFTPVGGSFTPGDRTAQFTLPSLDLVTSPLICFEDIFPRLGREGTQEETDFLVNLTNNGWFGESAAQWQHAATAIFRAVENGIPLVRCSNNGITCWVDPQGRLRDIFRDENGSEYGRGYLTIDLPLANAADRRPPLYNRHGDWFGWGCAAITLLGLIPTVARRVKRSQ